MEDSVCLGGAFTRYLKPHCNQSEVIHACWINRRYSTLSFYSQGIWYKRFIDTEVWSFPLSSNCISIWFWIKQKKTEKAEKARLCVNREKISLRTALAIIRISRHFKTVYIQFNRTCKPKKRNITTEKIHQN